MRTILFITIILFTGIFKGYAQENNRGKVESEGLINIPTNKINKIYIQPKPIENRLKSGQANKVNFEVTYVNFPEEAKRAFEYAISIWENLITSNVPIKLTAKWETIEMNALALSRPSSFYLNSKGAPVNDAYYPVALAEKLINENINSNEPDIICSFNKNYSWYFGTDGNTPSTQYDLVSAVLHEIVHGLGFSGFYNDNNGSGYISTSNNLPSIYDYYIFNSTNQKLADNSVFPSPSSMLHKQLTSNALKFFSPDDEAGNESTIDKVYAPSSWKNGSSIYHLERGNGLMDAYANKGEAIHQPGESTLKMLAEMGWKSVVFDFEELKDIEQPVATRSVEINCIPDFDITGSEVTVIFSKDYFISKDTVRMQKEVSANLFKAELPLDNFKGNVQYYFEMTVPGKKDFTWPGGAPSKKLSFRVGPDYSAPVLVHNPVKVISKTASNVNISALASDNFGVNSVMVEYKINGVQQEPVVLENEKDNLYKGLLSLRESTINDDVLEYRIVASDKSSRENKRTLPSNGYFKASIFNPQQPVYSYTTDFEYAEPDFSMGDFSISRVAGFAGTILHTKHPYPSSALEEEKYNLIAQLKSPVILQEGGEMTFDEVVLVEPGQKDASYTDASFWDYVIVEGSKDNGATWNTLTQGYDSRDAESWLNSYESSKINGSSTAVGQEGMFLKQTIQLTESKEFSAGDTVIFRFRLAADKACNGWGWAIDNLEIQKGLTIGSDNVIAEKNISVYPNPFSNSFYVDYSAVENSNEVEILVTDMFGKTVYAEKGIDAFYAEKKQVDLSNKTSGIYVVNISDGKSILSTNKIIKK